MKVSHYGRIPDYAPLRLMYLSHVADKLDMKSALFAVLIMGATSFSQEKKVFYGQESDSQFEKRTCAEILIDHKQATEMSHQSDRPHKQHYFNFFQDKFDCTKVTSTSAADNLIRSLTFQDSAAREQRIACVTMNMKYMAEHYKDLDKLAKVVQVRMTMHDATIYDSNPDLFTSACKNGVISNTFARLKTAKRPNDAQKDSQLLLRLNYDREDESQRCQVRSNARVGDVQRLYTNTAAWKDRSLCQTFLTNWNDWKRQNAIKEKPVHPEPPPSPEVDSCKLSCNWIKPSEELRLPAAFSANKCILDKYIECMSGTPVAPPASAPPPPINNGRDTIRFNNR